MESDCFICKTLVDRTSPHFITELDHSVVRLNPDQYFQGYTFVAFKRHETELFHLDSKEREGYCSEMVRVSQALSKLFRPDKMNYELMGNAQPHLHWHLIPRYRSCPFWGRPIWEGSHSKKRLSASEYKELAAAIRKLLPKTTHRF